MKFWLTLSFILVQFVLLAQIKCDTHLYSNGNGPPSKFEIGVNIHPGFLIAHRPDSRNLAGYSFGTEVLINQKYFSESSKLWTSYRGIQRGLSIFYFDLGDKDLLGNAIGISPNITTTLLSNNNASLKLRAGTGIAYLSKKFDAMSNRRNMAIGSHLNGVMQMTVFAQYETDRLRLNAGAGITHFSNASFKFPNLGVNMPNVFLGAQADFNTGSLFLYDLIKDKGYINMGGLELRLGYAYKESGLVKPQSFHIRQLHAAYTMYPKNFRGHRMWRTGFDMNLDKTYAYSLNDKVDLTSIALIDQLELGVFGGTEWRLGKVDCYFDLGFYVFKPNQHKFFTYQKLGFKYNVTPQIFLQSALKTHFGIADYFEWGIGYRLRGHY